MPKNTNITITIISLISIVWIHFIGTSIYAQNARLKNDIPLLNITGDTLYSAWAGGMHNPQFSAIDLNRDGLQDLVIFDRLDNSFSPYLNRGTAEDPTYQFSPEHLSTFDSCNCFGWTLLIDYNCDGNADLFCGDETATVEVYEQIVHENDSVSFERVFKFLESLYSSGLGRLSSPKTDIPAIIDVDFDGDVDFLTFSVLGNSVEWHRNRAIERFGRCDTLILELETGCWGHFLEGNEDNSAFIADTVSCPLNGFTPQEIRELSASRHAGSTMSLVDINGDSLYDALIGDISFNNIYALINGGRRDYAFFNDLEFTFPENETPIDVSVFPATFHVDVNTDGTKDLIIAPNSQFDNIENQDGVTLYLNEGTDELPLFTFTQKGFLQEEQVDMGLRANPAFIDYNGDGLQDLIVGNHSSTRNLGGRLLTQPFVSLYKNIGTVTNPAFQLISENFIPLNADDPVGFTPAAGDLDGDGDEDLLLGQETGELWYYEHNFLTTGDPDERDVFTEVSRNFENIDVGAFSAPYLYDFDQDNDLDLLIGNRKGDLSYYENIGSPTQFRFEFVTDNWGFISITDRFGSNLTNGWSRPILFDYDNDDEPELLAGGIDGQVRIFEGVNQALTDTLIEVDSLYVQDNLRFSAPAATRLVEGEAPFYVVGNERGGIWLLKGSDSDIVSSNSPDIEQNDSFLIYPNPVNSLITIERQTHSSNARVELRLLNNLGQQVISQENLGTRHQIDVSSLVPGMYILQIISEDILFTKKMLIYR